MLKNKKVAFLGAGSMAEAIISGMIQAEKLPSEHIIVTNKSNQERRNDLENKYGITGVKLDELNLDEIDMVVLAMKPKDAEKALYSIKNQLNSSHIIISVMAGITTSYIEDCINEQCQVVRVMPNTSSMIGQSTSGMSFGSTVQNESVSLCKELVGTFGEVFVIDEDKMDLFTGIAGSGPAYFYYLMEHIEQVAIDGGLDSETARKIGVQTMLGASQMMVEQEESPSELRENVTSPNGTTAAGLHALKKNGAGNAISQAIKSAAKRSKELSSKEPELVLTASR
ncbi:pyrroline-5-carboxylate reductase [Bacillus carboniphilus]|uniref:Pyrroline-5-carboxylate reductase n=1 Tax=Bacillus carboniphilus TaxID=86663 RepID=A0ABY9JRS9_9BACI|nr:pyrroline-5-carboxylate reductase [Bacillus carboniphilus]WLR42112.1 pyrroline-5-carboxylate reductase [Bacillus carboniphilus]